jgi:hypothetical protein
LSDAEIIDGVLKPTNIGGVWISETRTIPNITSCYLIAKGTNTSGAVISVSTNAGISYTELTQLTLTSLTNGTGLRIKIEFLETGVEIDTLSLQYK